MATSRVLQRDANDSCIEDILAKWYETVRYDFYQYTDLTSYMFSSRLLYQALFTLSFDPSSLGRYCRYYQSIRQESDRCPRSQNKAVILNGFALGDFMCMERLSDYMTAMPCLSKQESVDAFSSCSDNCSEYDSAPYVYTNPNEGVAIDDTIKKMRLDCRYLQCDIDCRYPLILKRCGKMAAAFVLDGLARVFISIWTGFKEDVQSIMFWAKFPDECRKLMRVAKTESTDDDDDVYLTDGGAINSILTNTTATTAARAPSFASSTRAQRVPMVTSITDSTVKTSANENPTSSRALLPTTNGATRYFNLPCLVTWIVLLRLLYPADQNFLFFCVVLNKTSIMLKGEWTCGGIMAK